MGLALCGRLHHRWMERRGSEHFLQLGLAVHIGQDGSALDGVVVLVEGKGAGDALNGAAGNGVDDSLLVLVRAGLEALLLGCLDAVHHGHGGIVAQGSKAVGVSLAVFGFVGVLKCGTGALGVAGAEVGILQLVGGGVALQAIPAVAAQEGNGQADALSLSQDLTDFLLYCFYNTGFKADNLGFSKKSKRIGRLGINFFEWLRSAARDEFEKSKHFDPPAHIDDLANYARDIVSEGNQTGEGWFLTGEMMELIHSGTPNIVCTQPFACLPNHVVGKGVIKELRHRFPESNIVAIDYDPGASEVNQLNRIKLMLSTANKNLAKQSL